MTDLLLEHLTAVPASTELTAIPWPAAIAPKPLKTPKAAGKALPKADVLVVTYTSAEKMALADVLTPGVQHTDWVPYTHNWSTFEAQLTGRSPAREEKCMASYYLSEISGQVVIVMGSNLHLSTDAMSLPIRALFKQMIREAQPSLVITTGTAGGIGTEALGDVLVTGSAKFNCTEDFKSQPWAQQRFVSSYQAELEEILTAPAGLFAETFPDLVAVNAARLKASGYAPRDPQIVTGDVETVDYFAFADTNDSYGVVKDDPQAAMEEMDDAVLGLVCAEDLGGAAPAWCSVRNASDPQMGTGSLSEQKKLAEDIYEKYGYDTSIGSAIACGLLIASTVSQE